MNDQAQKDETTDNEAAIDREALGRRVREVWIAWAKEQPNPKSSWLTPWEELSEPEREVDRRIGETIAREAVGKRFPLIGPVAAALAELDKHQCDPKPFGDGEFARCSICGDASFPVTFDAAYGLPKGTSRIIATQQLTAELLSALRNYKDGSDRGELMALLTEIWDAKELTPEEREETIRRFKERRAARSSASSKDET